MIQIEGSMQQFNLTLSKEITKLKFEDILVKIQKLESTFIQCLIYSKQEQVYENEKLQFQNQKASDSPENTYKDPFELFENDISQYFQKLREQFGNIQSTYFLTTNDINKFFDEAIEQLNNKTKIFQDILKLKMINNTSDLFNKVYPTNSNIILKKWYLKNYCHPYPNQVEITKLIKKTQLSKKKILNWFINARNSFKRKKQKSEKYKFKVQQQYQHLLKSMKQVQKEKYGHFVF